MDNREGPGWSEREVGLSAPDPPPLKPVRPIRRPEIYPSRRMQQQSALLYQHQSQSVPRTQPWEPSLPRSTPLHKSPSTQSLTPADPPWGGVTLNRCLLVTVLVLLLTSGLRTLHEALRGPAVTHEGEEGLTRHCGALKHRGVPSEPQSSLWEVVFWWVPDMTDEDDEDEEESGQNNRGRSKRKVADRVSRGVRNRPLLEKLMKPRENKLKDRRRKNTKDDIKKRKEKDSFLKETDEEEVDVESEEESF